MGKKKDKKGKRQAQAESPVSDSASKSVTTAEPRPKMSSKEFEQEMEKLQVELVKMQEWVRATGAKVCVLFEGRDTAGKGGVIRLRARDEDPRKIWKLTPMDLRSYSRWYDYSRARDAMFAATDTPETPWYVVDANDKRRARLNCIAHLLSQVPYEEVPRKPVKFPKRQAKGDYVDPDYPYRMVPAIY